MNEIALSLPEKSTTVRTVPGQLVWLRRGLKVLSAVAPGLADAAAADLFFRPRRSAKAREPEVAGLEAKRFQVEVGGVRLVGWSWGEGPAVLLPHGWEGWAGQMTGFVRPVVEKGWRAVAFDMPAHGLSEGSRVSVLDMARALGKVARLFAPVHGIVGHSMGGTATALALAEGVKAQRAVLLAPGAEPGYFARQAARIFELSPRRTEGMLTRVLKRFGGSWVENEIPNLVRAVQVPLLLLHDPDDQDVPWAHGAAIAAAWPGARLEATPGLGHRRILKDPAVISRVAEFLGQKPAA